MVYVDVFSRLVLVESLKSKYSSDAAAAFRKNLRKKIKPDREWFVQGTDFGGDFKIFAIVKPSKIRLLK